MTIHNDLDKAVVLAVAWAIQSMLIEAMSDATNPVISPLNAQLEALRELREKGTKVDADWWGYRHQFSLVMDDLDLDDIFIEHYRRLIFNEWDGWEERID